MENFQHRSYSVQTPVRPLKDSIRDMIRLQREYQMSDELFWEIFNTCVLLNEQIDVNTFLRDLNVLAVYA